VDVQREIDVIEEILRIYGYNNIDFGTQLKSSLSFSEKPDKNKVKNVISDYLVSNGFVEAMNNSLTKGSYYEGNEVVKREACVEILNPLSIDLDVMRQSLLFGGLESIAYNQNRKNADLKLFEFGNTYHTYKEREFEEYGHIALFTTGAKNAESWNTPKSDVDFFELKGFVENILQRVGVKKYKVKATKLSYLNDGLSFETKKNKLVDFGIIETKIQKSFGIKKPVFYADFNWEGLLAEITNAKIKFQPTPKFPEVRRDLALLLDEEVRYADLVKIANQAGGNLLQSTNLFDVYEGKNLAAGKKSYAVSFTFQDPEKTLVDEQIDIVMNKLIDSYQKQLGAEIR
jgi:phenylalanyl-tRNA synthetase beta chain